LPGLGSGRPRPEPMRAAASSGAWNRGELRAG
jgi:hypothetical protein